MRLTKVIVLGSTLLAFAAHAWLLSSQHPWLWWAVALAFALSLAVARTSLTLGLIGPLVLAYTAPVAVMLSADSLDYNLIVVWLALIAGPIFAGSDWRRWHTAAWWTPALVAWAIVLALTWPVIALREIDFSLIAAGTLNTPNGLFAPAPPISAAGVVLTALGQLVGVLWLDLLWARFGTTRLPQAERFVLVPMVVSVAIASAVGLYQKTVDITWLSVRPWSEIARAAGTMFDGNSFGIAAAIWAALTVALTLRLGWPIVIGVAVTTFLAIGMWTSGSRTALLVLTTGIASAAVTLLRSSRRWYARSAPVALLVAATVILFVVAASRADPYSPLSRVRQLLPSDPDGVVTLARTLWEREGYGPVAARMIADYPWTGVGVGAFPLIAPDYFYLAHGFTISGDNAQNWWRHQIAELGWFGALPAIGVTVGILSMIFVGTPRTINRAPVTLLRGTIVGVGLASLVGMGTQHPALFLTFVTLVFWLGALLPERPVAEHPLAVWWGVPGIAMLVVAGQLYSATHGLRVPHRAEVHGFTYGYGFSEPAPHATLGLARRTARHAVGVIAAEHAYFRVTLVAPHATTAEPVHVKLWRGRDPIVELLVSGPEPIVRFVGVPAGDDQLMIELDVSPPAADGTGMTFAGTWVREIPGGTNPALVVP